MLQRSIAHNTILHCAHPTYYYTIMMGMLKPYKVQTLGRIKLALFARTDFFGMYKNAIVTTT